MKESQVKYFSIFQNIDWFYFTGLIPVVSFKTRQLSMEIVLNKRAFVHTFHQVKLCENNFRGLFVFIG